MRRALRAIELRMLTHMFREHSVPDAALCMADFCWAQALVAWQKGEPKGVVLWSRLATVLDEFPEFSDRPAFANADTPA